MFRSFLAGKVLVLPVNPPQPTMTAVFGDHISSSPTVLVKQEPEQNITISHQGSQQYINVYPQLQYSASGSPVHTPTPPLSTVKQEKIVLPSIDDFNHGILAKKSSATSSPLAGSSATSIKTELDAQSCGISKDIKQIVTFLKEEPKQAPSPQPTSTTSPPWGTSRSSFLSRRMSTRSLIGPSNPRCAPVSV